MENFEELANLLPNMESDIDESETYIQARGGPGLGKYVNPSIMYGVFLKALGMYATTGLQQLLVRAPHIQELIDGIEPKTIYSPIIINQVSTTPLQSVNLSEYCQGQDCGVVQELFCCQEVRGVYHEYILLKVQEPSNNISWARIERRTERKGGYIQGTYTPSFIPIDLATTAPRFEDLVNHGWISGQPDDRVMEAMIFSGVHLVTLKRLAGLFTEEKKRYTPFKYNCWSFCLLIVDCMRGYAQPQALELRRPGLLAALRHKIKYNFGELFQNLNACRTCPSMTQSQPQSQPQPQPAQHTTWTQPSGFPGGWRLPPAQNNGFANSYHQPNGGYGYSNANNYSSNGSSGYPGSVMSIPTPDPFYPN